MAELSNSSALALKSFRAIPYGPPDRSKTFSSVTMSDFCPADITHVRPKVLKTRGAVVPLSDLLWLCFDKDALAGFKQQGLEAPAIDMSTVEPMKLPAEVKDCIKKTEDHVAKGKTKAVIVDTLTSFDGSLTHYQAGVRGLTKNDLYQALFRDHIDFFQRMKALPCHVLFLCHAKAPFDMGDAAQAQRKQAQGLTDVYPHITGQALAAYRADSTFIFNVTKEKSQSPEGEAFFFNTVGRATEAKQRVMLRNQQGQILEKVPADWRKVFDALK